MPTRTSFIPHCTTLIFDIGDVLFSWSPDTPTRIPPKTLRGITTSPTWGLYERGQLSQDECYHLIAQEYQFDVSDVAAAFQHARDSLKPDDTFISFIRQLKAEMGTSLRVFAMSNISGPDYQVLRTKDADWSIFDHVFTSAAAGMRKPNLCFYRYVLEATGSDPRYTAFVDDKAENVLAARSLGLHGIVFDKDTVFQTLRYLVCDPVRRGRAYLDAHAGRLESVTDSGVTIEDNFAQLLILEATNDQNLINVRDCSQEGKWNFFKGKPALTTTDFPFDFDTTSIALTLIKHHPSTVRAVMDEMLRFLDEDGIIQTYFDHKRRRTDPVVCVNVLTLFHSQGRGSELSSTQAWVLDVLKNRAYLDGTRYYTSPDSFLYFLARLLKVTPDVSLREALRPLLEERLRESIGAPGDALALSMRIIACSTLAARNEVDLRKLLPMQLEDGSWGPGNIYKYGSSGIGIGNCGLSTAVALKAIQSLDSDQPVTGWKIWEGWARVSIFLCGLFIWLALMCVKCINV
ncbi:HAD-like protein [Trametopsis cervina]|nr:HAD-like protein [Trametopsis cervina]